MLHLVLTITYSWPDLREQPKDDTILRHEQIKLRLAECEEIVSALQKISRGEPVPQTALTPVNFEFGKWINADKPIMAGHSLGGSAAVSAIFVSYRANSDVM